MLSTPDGFALSCGNHKNVGDMPLKTLAAGIAFAAGEVYAVCVSLFAGHRGGGAESGGHFTAFAGSLDDVGVGLLSVKNFASESILQLFVSEKPWEYFFHGPSPPAVQHILFYYNKHCARCQMSDKIIGGKIYNKVRLSGICGLEKTNSDVVLYINKYLKGSGEVKLIGLCGRSGSGKGYVSECFLRYAIPSIDTDALYREMTCAGEHPPDACGKLPVLSAGT